MWQRNSLEALQINASKQPSYNRGRYCRETSSLSCDKDQVRAPSGVRTQQGPQTHRSVSVDLNPNPHPHASSTAGAHPARPWSPGGGT